VADEEMTLEALEREAAAELETEEAPVSADTGWEEAKPAESDEPEATEESASTEQAAHGKDKRVEIPVSKLAKLRESRREANNKAGELQRQNEELLAKLALLGNQQPAAPVMPTLESCEYDDSKYASRMAEWQQHQVRAQLADLQRQQLEEQQNQLFHQRAEQEIAKHYERAAALGVPDYEDSERIMRDEFGDGAIDAVINAIGEGSERVLFHLGKNSAKRQEIAELMRHDPSGLRAMTRLGQILATLSTEPKAKTISQAPAADKPVSGGQGGGTESAVIKKLERLSRSPDRTAYREYRKTLTKAGQSALLKQYDANW
jgi:hypothetical protein